MSLRWNSASQASESRPLTTGRRARWVSDERETVGAAAQCFIQLLTAEGCRVAELKENTKRVKLKKKRVDGLFSQCRRAADTLKSHAACVARTKRSARTWKLLRLTPPTNGFQQLTSPLHHLGQTLKFLAKPWNTEGKKRKKDGNKFMSRASVRVAVHARVQRLKATERNNFSRGSQEIYRFRRAGCSIRHKVQSNGTALKKKEKKKRRNHEYLTAHHISCVKCVPATAL